MQLTLTRFMPKGERLDQRSIQARGQIADAIHAKSSEIYFTGGGSESDNWALFGVMRALEGKNHIITTQIEHHAILNACAALESLGYDVTYVPVDQWGRVSPQDIEKAIRPETGLVSVMAANNEVGTIQPIAEIARIAHAHGVLMHTDAVQAVGHIPIDVAALNVDLLSMAAHKFYGPKGIGALYIKNGVKITNLVYGGEQERGYAPELRIRLRSWVWEKRLLWPAPKWMGLLSRLSICGICWKMKLCSECPKQSSTATGKNVCPVRCW